MVGRTGGTANLTWNGTTGADAYSVSRGILANLAPDAYGDCLADGLAVTALDDAGLPASGSGFFYLVQAQNYDCGLGSLGTTSSEAGRVNLSAGSCQGGAFIDYDATSDTPVAGTVFGSFSETTTSDNQVQSIEEEISSGGKPSLRHTLLEHRWSFDIGAGSRVEFHVEGFRSSSSDGDGFAFEYSTDGGSAWNPITVATLPTSDNGVDLAGTLPGSLSGPLEVRVIDTNRSQGGLSVDTVSVDDLFIRVAP